MFPLKNKHPEESLRLPPLRAQAELEHWQNLVFSFDMDDEQPNNQKRGHVQNNRSRSTSISGAGQPSNSGSVDAQDAALLAQFAAAAGITQLPHPGHDHQPYPPPTQFPQTDYPPLQITPYHQPNLSHLGIMQLPPLSSLDFPWAQPPPPHSHPPLTTNQFNYDTFISPLSFIPQHYPPAPPLASGSSILPPTPDSGVPQQPIASTSATTQEVLDNEIEGATITEEKRRRNTAASGASGVNPSTRFRIKKKMKTTNLERSVSDLTGRAEELEREAADLRRENGWLKEIVMMKGNRFPSTASLQLQLAAGPSGNSGQSTPASATEGVASPTITTPSSSSLKDDDDESDEDDRNKTASKRKGKARAKKDPSFK